MLEGAESTVDCHVAGIGVNVDIEGVEPGLFDGFQNSRVFKILLGVVLG